jgi:hypothetical protein
MTVRMSIERLRWLHGAMTREQARTSRCKVRRNFCVSLTKFNPSVSVMLI